MKTIKVSARAQAEFPDKAEIIRFEDELGLVSDHIKLNGKPLSTCRLLVRV